MMLLVDIYGASSKSILMRLLRFQLEVVNGKVTSEIKYLSAIEEEKFTIAQANSAISKDGSFVEELVACRKNLNFELSNRENIELAKGVGVKSYLV